ncbi:outer membrane beta-barrel protein [Chryseobacterium polytrichastri]|uniref:Outer membrane protein beta-barrel domain-containing protein n=1 Tax=Chryseobacterium polytrichastri TaxID=1302687 RepID=A0A1M7BQY4_9FLAO|nr:outer membrane beta-barrel protein [Chryseobacterium polytrichastri]SHL57364.1 Outer membrane protein beta-barrel domain-containing protein [Chryseobacterium polytrichastri]
MKNQWLDNMRSRMEDHESDVPDGLWDDIKDELFNEEGENTVVGLGSENELARQEKKTSGKKIRTILYRMSAVAAVIALFFAGNEVIQFYNKKEPSKKIAEIGKGVSIKKNNNPLVSNELEKEGIIAIQQNNEQHNNILNRTTSTLKKYLTKVTGNELNTIENSTSENLNIAREADLFKQDQHTAQETDINSDNQSLNEINTHTETLGNEVEFQNKLATADVPKKTKRQRDQSWMLSLLTGKASPSSAEQFPGYATLSGSPVRVSDLFSAAGYEESPLREVLLANQNEKVDAKIQHKIPVTLGISMYYSLGKKWGIGTGINYTKLSSELRTGSETNFIKSDQTVHYIGVPVQVNYNVVQKGVFTGYVTAGALIEKSVAGNVKTKYIVNDEVKDEIKENVETKPFQFSVNTAVGIQLKVANKIGIYAEPGIGYHFKDNSSLNTIYKEKPFNFNMNFGIRLLIDK